MKKIFVRSPYFITIDEAGQTGSKLEIFLWNKGTTEPTVPTYVLSKPIASPTQTEMTYNISNYAKEFIKPVNAPSPNDAPVAEVESNNWCYCKVDRYKIVGATSTKLDSETLVCLNGYTSYMSGYNQSSVADFIPLFNPDINILSSSDKGYVNVWIEGVDRDLMWNDNAFTVNGHGLFELEYKDEGEYILYDDIEGELFKLLEINVEVPCAPKYEPILCEFINRYGGWQNLYFFKANLQSINVTSKDFQLLPSNVDYNPVLGQKRVFNKQGNKKIKCNTGWVDENYFELIQDLLLSEVVLLNNEPAIVKSQSADFKTHLKDKNINYEIEFEYSFGLINDVI
jgi:hypothetical protein